MKRISSLFLAFALILGLCACAKSASGWQEQYDLGVRYLSEGNYEEAIIAFTAAIEIDPKRPEAYIQLAEIYAENGDADRLWVILTQGAEATGDSDLIAWLERIKESGGETEATYSFQTQVSANELDVDAEYLTVRVQDGRTATITVSGLTLQDSYLTNLSTSEEDMAEYFWEAEMYDDQGAYSVSTACWAFEPGAEATKELADMQHSVWAYDGDSWPWICDAAMSYTADSITWNFTVPEEYPFDFANVNQYVVSVYDSSQNLNLTRSYTRN